MLPPLPSVPTLRNVQDVQDVCRNVVHTGKDLPPSSSLSMPIFYFLTNPNVMDHLFADKGLEILTNMLSPTSSRSRIRHLRRTCPPP